MKLWALSDLHVGHTENRRIIEQLPAHPGDWLILGGDLGETTEHLRFVFDTLAPRFGRLLWVPGNHELWTTPQQSQLRGEAKYQALVALCREYRVLTPEDPYELFTEGATRYLIAPLFVLYDYTFCPEGLDVEGALAWAREAGLECVDEHLLHPDPYPTRAAWCAARCELTERRLEQALAAHDGPTVLINHFPLVPAHAELPLIPRFRIWCGTVRTQDWHRRFRAAAVIYGHLHIPRRRFLDGVRFEEVSLGYPRQWKRAPERFTTLRQILPAAGSVVESPTFPSMGTGGDPSPSRT